MLKIKKIKPMFTALVTTMDKYTEPQYITGTGIIDPTKSKSGLKEYQKVISIGESVRGIVEGDIVCINPSRYAVKKYTEGETKEMIQSMQQVISYNFNIPSIGKLFITYDRVMAMKKRFEYLTHLTK